MKTYGTGRLKNLTPFRFVHQLCFLARYDDKTVSVFFLNFYHHYGSAVCLLEKNLKYLKIN